MENVLDQKKADIEKNYGIKIAYLDVAEHAISYVQET